MVGRETGKRKGGSRERASERGEIWGEGVKDVVLLQGGGRGL